MSPSQRLLVGALVLITAAIGYASGRALLRPVERVVQPIAFNHAKHVEEAELECGICHPYYETRAHSGLPRMTTCLDCHEGEPEIQKVADAEGEEPFRKLFRLADHTYYSHRRHVVSGGLECETCHGPIARAETPPERPLVRITMDFCVGCHRRSGISTDCTRCHR